MDNNKALEIFNSSLSISELMKKYNIAYGTVWNIKNGKSWASITKKQL
jgi:DNA invertase Pin-like site-specific DNA recombinase